MKLDEARAGVPRVASGIDGFDLISFGGLPAARTTLVSGTAGAGKTTFAVQVLLAGASDGDPGVLVTCEESARWSLGAAEDEGRLDVLAVYPERMGLEDLLVSLRRVVRQHAPDRVAIDSLTALERIASPPAFREFVVGLLTTLKEAEILGLLTNTSSSLLGGDTVTASYVSTMTDGIVLLRYVELDGETRRAIAILKMRGARHDHLVREYVIDGAGMHVGEPLSALGPGFLRGGVSNESAWDGPDGRTESGGNGNHDAL